MKTVRNTVAAFAALMVLGLVPIVNAASVTLVPTTPTQNVADGDFVSFDIHMDFTGEPTLGGAFSIIYDASALGFVSLFRDDTVGDPMFSRDPDIFDGFLDSWTVGSLSGLPETAVLGNVLFQVLPTMGQHTALTLVGPPTLCGCWTAVDFDSQYPDYGMATLSRVPVPPAAWLLLSGVAASFGVSRKRGDAG